MMPEEINQKQKAGNNSQLIQADVINIGIDEKRAREICDEQFELARQKFTSDAYECANIRVEKLATAVFSKINSIENSLSYFADPSFQILLNKAQVSACSTDRVLDYDMLSELLACRIVKGKTRKINANISRAVEIVAEIDDDALCALTVSYAINRFIPVSADVFEGLNVLNDLFAKLLYMELPSGNKWMDHLDTLGAIRISSFGSFKKFRDFYCEILNGYCSVGIQENSENHQKALQMLKENNLSTNVLCPNKLLSGYVLIPLL